MVALGSVTPVNSNLVTSNDQSLGNVWDDVIERIPGSCCGGAATLTVTTTFTAGDNNVFGPFTRTATCALDLGLRAPVVISGDAVERRLLGTAGSVDLGSVLHHKRGTERNVGVCGGSRNPNNVINATRFVILNANLIDALFNFGSRTQGRRS